MMRRYPIPLLIITLIFIAACYPACQSSPTRDALEKRVQRCWKYRTAGDWGSIYDMLCGDEKKMIARDHFLRDKKALFKSTSFQIQSIRVDGNRGEVVINHGWQIELLIPGPDRIKTGSTLLTEQWVFENGDWFIALNRTSGNAPAK